MVLLVVDRERLDLGDDKIIELRIKSTKTLDPHHPIRPVTAKVLRAIKLQALAQKARRDRIADSRRPLWPSTKPRNPEDALR